MFKKLIGTNMCVRELFNTGHCRKKNNIREIPWPLRLLDGKWTSAEDPKNFAAFCIWFYRKATESDVYEIVAYLCYRDEDETASSQIIPPGELT